MGTEFWGKALATHPMLMMRATLQKRPPGGGRPLPGDAGRGVWFSELRVAEPDLIYFWPFFSSWPSTEAANFFTSAGVGFFEPESTFEASVESADELCFFAIL